MKVAGKNVIGGLVIIPAGIICSLTAFESLKEFLLHSNLNIVFFSGAILYCALRFFVKQIGYDFIDVGEVLVHELVHGFFSIVFLGDVKSLSVYPKKGGQVSVSRSNFIVELSPYCFPLIAIAICAVSPFFVKGAAMYVAFLAGFALGQHICSLIKDFHLGQSDILNNGIVFSFSVVLFFNVLFIGLISVTLNEGFSGVPIFAARMAEYAEKCFFMIINFDYGGYWIRFIKWFNEVLTAVGI